MGNSNWRTQISFLLAGAIFVLCQMIVSGTRNNVDEAGVAQASDRGFQDGGARGILLGAGPTETDRHARPSD